MLVFGLVSAAVQPRGFDWWVGLNLWAAFLHYAYDGLIWKLRRPETARALGAEGSLRPERPARELVGVP